VVTSYLSEVNDKQTVGRDMASFYDAFTSPAPQLTRPGGFHSKLTAVDARESYSFGPGGPGGEGEKFSAYGPGRKQEGEHSRDYRRAAAVIARDTLLFSLLSDANSRSFAEDRVLEILGENIAPQSTQAMAELISNALRTENISLKERNVACDEQVAFVMQKLQTYEHELNDSKVRYDQACHNDNIREVMRKGEDNQIRQMLKRMKEMSDANTLETKQLQLRLESVLAENHELQMAVKDAECREKDKQVGMKYLLLLSLWSTRAHSVLRGGTLLFPALQPLLLFCLWR